MNWRAFIADGLFVGGLAAVSFGSFQIYVPLGWIVAGAGTMWLGIALGREADE